MKKILAALLVVFSLLGSHSRIIAYSEEFTDNTYLSDPRWNINLNGGSSLTNDGRLVVQSPDGSKRFPYVIIDYSDELTGDYSFEISFKFLRKNILQGAGLVLSDRVLTNGEPDSNDFKGIWLWPSPMSDIYVASNLCGSGFICPLTVHETINNSGALDHTLRVEKLGTNYELTIDGTRDYLFSSTRELKYFWLGNPEILVNVQTWPVFSLDYIRINASNPISEVPDYKQYDPLWADEIYDDATRWSSNPTIERWGCALASAAMVLKYHGYDVTPSSLNTWLKLQEDGYVRNGLINWLAVSRYSKESPHTGSFDALEYSRYPANRFERLDVELEEMRPAILGEPGHFIVAKAKTEGSYLINDPGYSNRTDLLAYDNKFLSLNSYTPSNTDLSYVMLVVDPEIEVTVLDSQGNVVEKIDEYIQDPISDAVDGEATSGEPVKIILLPKPDGENYQLILSGNGSYDLDWYLYDNNGEVTQGNLGGVVNQGINEEDNYLISLSDGNMVVGIDGDLTGLIDSLQEMLNGRRGVLYDVVRGELALAERLMNGGNNFVPEVLIKVIYYHLRSFPRKFFDPGLAEQMRQLILSYWVS